MAKATVLVYPYIYMDLEGKNFHYGVQGYPGEDTMSLEYGGHVIVCLPPTSIEVEEPDEAQRREACLHLLRAHRTELQGKHVAMLTKLQFMENQLLGLAAPEGVEVLDAIGEPARDTMQQFGDSNHHADDEDDIPF